MVKRKKYDKLPDDAPRDTRGRKTRTLNMTRSAITLMSPATLERMKQHAHEAGYPTYSEYIRHLIDDLPPVDENVLVLKLDKTTIRKLKRHADDADMSLREYVNALSDLG